MMKRVKMMAGVLLLSVVSQATDYGLVIGYSGGKGMSSKLQGTSKDAKAFAKILERSCDKKNIHLLLEKDASKANIKKKLGMLEKNIQKGDRFYFYFSGHGAKAGEKRVFLKKIETADDRELSTRLNSTAFITHGFKKENAYDSVIISTDDLKPVFQKLDRKGAHILMFAEACFSGDAVRSLPGEDMKWIDTVLEIKSKIPPKDELYENLIFFGASLSTLQAREVGTKEGKRGEFTVKLEYCLKSQDTDIDRDGSISKEELQQCMIDEFPNFASSAAIYPVKRLDSEPVLKAPARLVKKINKEMLRVKYNGKMDLSTVANVVSEEYALELVNNGPEVDIYRAGSLYASVDKKRLVKYLKSYKLFALKNSHNSNIKLAYESTSTEKAEDVFCKDENISISVSDLQDDEDMAAFTLDKNGRIIVLETQWNSFEAKVKKPFGIDRVKVFTFKNKSINDKIVAYSKKNRGILGNDEVRTLYHMLSKEKSLKGRGLLIKTVKTELNECMKGERI